MTKPPDLSLVLPAREQYIPVAVSAALAFAEDLGFGGQAAHISLAMEEAMGHALAYGYGGPEDTIEVRIASTSFGIRIQARFRGLPLQFDKLPQYDPKRVAAHADDTGIGPLLIEKMMDKSAFSIQPGGMRLVSMEKELPAELAEKAPLPRTEESCGPIEYVLRFAEVGDAEDISRLAFQSHGAVLFHEHIYYPVRVAEMLRSGEMRSVVAEAPQDGGVVGHGALVRRCPGAQVEELTFGIVSPRCRRTGCATGLAEMLEEDARQRGLYAIIVFAVTNHPHSQKAVHTQGFRECGMILDTSPASQSWGRSGADDRRIGNVVLLKYLKGGPDILFHAPDRHRSMIEKIYANLGVSARFASGPESAPPTGETDIWTMMEMNEGWSIIGVNQYGADTFMRVAEALNHAKAQGAASIQLYLPLGEPATRTMTARFETLGFFFVGVGPDDEGNEGLLLQYVNSSHSDYDLVHVHSGFGQELKEYVRACDPRVPGAS
ncbi:GNAT family N-acetyltransferase [Paucidesulfovibrio longus]|uniref:GNAT family N-acetyltransferase n=1 Tax=Paucidesulfovibrio longus TaxID=889 RepID=UPI0003B4D8D3|nr:GNAT family N-acetyltransferase [Paucidesulfovibrio longus]